MADLCREGVPLSEKDIAQMKNMFTNLPSYQNESISTDDFTNLANGMQWTQSPEQIAAYKVYFDKNFEGRVKLEDFLARIAVMHDTNEFASMLAVQMDKNGDGFISEEEFKDLLEVIIVFDANLPKITYDAFVAEADTNEDGLVSVCELAAWIAKKTKCGH